MDDWKRATLCSIDACVRSIRENCEQGHAQINAANEKALYAVYETMLTIQRSILNDVPSRKPRMKLGTETGSLVNHVASTSDTVPEVGMGATILMWSDRKAGTIVKVTPTQIHVQEDTATRTDKNGLSESQEYTYEPDPKGSIRIFRKTKNGYRWSGRGLWVGVRQAYHDPTF